MCLQGKNSADRQRQAVRERENVCARRESSICLPAVLGTLVSREFLGMKTAHCHFCFDITGCFEIALAKIENNMIILWCTRGN